MAALGTWWPRCRWLSSSSTPLARMMMTLRPTHSLTATSRYPQPTPTGHPGWWWGGKPRHPGGDPGIRQWTQTSGPQVSMLAVDELYGEVPALERDRYWDAASPRAPYTAAAAPLRQPAFRGSAFDVA